MQVVSFLPFFLQVSFHFKSSLLNERFHTLQVLWEVLLDHAFLWAKLVVRLESWDYGKPKDRSFDPETSLTNVKTLAPLSEIQFLARETDTRC